MSEIWINFYLNCLKITKNWIANSRGIVEKKYWLQYHRLREPNSALIAELPNQLIELKINNAKLYGETSRVYYTYDMQTVQRSNMYSLYIAPLCYILRKCWKKMSIEMHNIRNVVYILSTHS